MEQVTGNQQPSEQEQIAVLAEQLEEMRQRMFRLEGQAEVLRQMASRPWIWSAVVFLLGMIAILFTFLLLLPRR
jgi:hypothetical protein